MTTRLAPPDQDLRTILEAQDKGLEALIRDAQRYRAILRVALRRTWTGEEPTLVRASLEVWRPILQRIKRMARDLRA